MKHLGLAAPEPRQHLHQHVHFTREQLNRMTDDQFDRTEAAYGEIVALEREVAAAEAQRASFRARAAELYQGSALVSAGGGAGDRPGDVESRTLVLRRARRGTGLRSGPYVGQPRRSALASGHTRCRGQSPRVYRPQNGP